MFTHAGRRSLNSASNSDKIVSKENPRRTFLGKQVLYRDTVDFILKRQGSCGLTTAQYLYPMFALDLTAKQATPANRSVKDQTVIERNAATPVNKNICSLIFLKEHIKIHMTEIVLQEHHNGQKNR